MIGIVHYGHKCWRSRSPRFRPSAALTLLGWPTCRPLKSPDVLTQPAVAEAATAAACIWNCCLWVETAPSGAQVSEPVGSPSVSRSLLSAHLHVSSPSAGVTARCVLFILPVSSLRSDSASAPNPTPFAPFVTACNGDEAGDSPPGSFGSRGRLLLLSEPAESSCSRSRCLLPCLLPDLDRADDGGNASEPPPIFPDMED
mmetsp:Transcript_30278/g.69675  ORF Transcript_30278/g.69675 Transcript_30278/m.69675 type:complete len:200 (+) Transcript_30278:20-619(+)